MATYAIGDIQGCFETFQALLEKIGFDPKKDRLWLTGDLVNRGPYSLEVLRWCYRNHEKIIAVLGNHDLHLLARAWSGASAKRRDTLEKILAAPDRKELLAWLAGLPLVHREGNFLLLHGGLLPEWKASRVEALAQEAEGALRGPEQKSLLTSLAQRPPSQWNPATKGVERHSHFIQILTRLRVCTPQGEVDWEYSGPVDQIPDAYHPWFSVPGLQHGAQVRIFGHWASLGLHITPTVRALDSGCVWGRRLTAFCLENGAVTQTDCIDPLS